MAELIMIRSLLNQHVIDIENNSTSPGALLDAYTAKSGTVPVLNPGDPPPKLAANQTWEVLPDPAGSQHKIIKNPGTGNCIDIQNNSTSPGVRLDAYPVKSKDNQNQLWDLLPDPFGSGGFFLQNPQTGFVIEIEHGSNTVGAALVVNPRRLFDSNRQLWAGVQAGGAVTGDLPLLTIATPPFSPIIGSGQYVLLPKDQAVNLTGVTVTLDIIEDVVTDSFSVQINGNPPYPPPGYNPKPGQSPYKWDVEWIQFGMVMTNNTLVLFTQLWPPSGKGDVPPAFPQPSVDEYSPASMLTLNNNTIPAGTRIVLTLDNDKNDYVTSLTGKVFNSSGAQIGQTVTLSAIGQPTWKGSSPQGPPVKESELAPLGAFQVVIVGPPGGKAHFTSGLGTLTVATTPDISASPGPWPDPEDSGTGETSNMFYGDVQSGLHHQIAQPFGVPSPSLTPQTGLYTFSGAGLYPNTSLKAKVEFPVEGGKTVAGVIESLSSTTAPDGSFSLIVTPQDGSIPYNPYASVAVTVTDSYGNWAGGQGSVTTWPKGWTGKSGTSPEYK